MFTNLVTLLQVIPKEVTIAALGANPWNTAAYGLLVFVLMLFAVMNYRDRRRSDKALITFMTTTVGLLGRVEEKMVVLHDVRRALDIMGAPKPSEPS